MTEYMAMSVGGRFDYRNADQVIRGRDIMLLDWDPSGFILIIAVSEILEPTLREKGLTVPAKREYNCIRR